jgi:HEAT repeat protein
MRVYRVVCAMAAVLAPLAAQKAVQPKDVREIAKGGSGAIPKMQELLRDPNPEVRAEVVRQLTDIGTGRSLDPLILATRDRDVRVEMLATDGLVNFYLPGYSKNGIGGTLRIVGNALKAKFTDTNDQAIDPYIAPRPEVIAALAGVVANGASTDAQANAARALGILRGREAVPQLVEAAHSKDTDVIYESIVALQKIRDASAGPRISFRLRDLDPKVQIATVEAMGLLLNREAIGDLIDLLNNTRDDRVRRAALTSLAMLPSEQNRAIYARFLNDKDEKMRAAAAEGFGRLRQPGDVPMLEKALKNESKPLPRLSLSFALVLDGRTEAGLLSPLQFVVNNLNSAMYKGAAFPLLVELARDAGVRKALYGPMLRGLKDEKIALAGVLARSGDKDSIAPLKQLANDPDPAVSQEAVRAATVLQSR